MSVRVFDPYDPDCEARAASLAKGRTKADLVELAMIQHEAEARLMQSIGKAVELLAQGRAGEARESLKRCHDVYQQIHHDRAEFWFGSTPGSS